MRIHFISIGGSVMHQLAIALHKKGYQVTGSDDEIFEPSRSNLAKEGLLPENFGWDASRIEAGIDAIILGMHARADNPELLRATSLNIPVYSFPEYIYQESLDKTRVVIGGSHGKTTTTSMIMHVLKHAGKDFDFLVGAKLEGFEQSVKVTSAPIIVCEGDEYPASALEKRPKFHFLFPNIAVLTGIAWDHINVFPTFDNYLEQFRIFIRKIEPGGTLIYNETDPELVKLVGETKRADIQYKPYGLLPHTMKDNITYIRIGAEEAAIKVFGDHNLLNLHAAWLVTQLLGVSAAEFLAAVPDFKGASKRLEILLDAGNKTVFRDFAHAPSKVKATLQAVKHQYPQRKLIAVLELHTYSSLNADFMPQYDGALDAADKACVFYSHHAMQIKKMPDLPTPVVLEGFKKQDLKIFHIKAELENWLFSLDYAYSTLLLMSSGTYENLDLVRLVDRVQAGD